MSNMTSVKSALDAEIKHAKEGIAFYSMRIATLEKMIAQLDQLDNSHEAGKAGRSIKPAGKRKYTRSAESLAKSVAAVTTSAKSGGGKLPATTAKFWQSLLSQTPISNKEIIKGAIAALKIKPSAADMKKLKQRLANAITIMTKDGSMQSEGTGRARRFSIKA